MAVSEHYCRENLVSVSVFAEADSCCDMGNCCHNETRVYQLKVDFSAPAVSVTPDLVMRQILGHTLFAVEVPGLPEAMLAYREFIEPLPHPSLQVTLALRQSFLL
ncbi:MAG TPA: hypothetical protein VFC92_09075 [Bacteroidales bacterium]|nr:hypothetical protein [Bacteroidales bacterium]